MNERRSGTELDNPTEVSRDDVRDFYSKAAVKTQESLCCPVNYDTGDLSHIPKEVLEISYGCGSPVNSASLKTGESLVDLGSGGGIDCFIAAKLVGPEGNITGVDMTEEMLGVARNNSKQVSENLGYNNIEFKHGFLESIPKDDESVDVVTSNCVINLSTQKSDVFNEIHRILKPGGRFVIADIISDREVPKEMRDNQELWGECVSGALTIEEFLDYTRKANFQGISVDKDYLWKEVEGIKFYSFIFTAYKPIPLEESCFSTITAIYSGPLDSVTCEGITFPLGKAVEVKGELAQLLQNKPYSCEFDIIDPENEQIATKDDDSSCCG